MRNPRAIWNVFLALAAALLLGGVAAAANTPAKLHLTFAWYLPNTEPSAQQDIQAAKNIEADSNGAITVTTYPAGSLYTEGQMAEAIQNNSVNIGVVGLHWWGSQDPALAFDQIPFLFPGGVDELHTLIHGQLGQDVNTVLETHGVIVIGWGYYGYDGDIVNSKHAIANPSDLKGLKLRADGALPSHLFQMNGATPVSMSSNEVYTALQRGTIDGAISGMGSIVARKWYEVAKYVTAMKSGITLYPIYANLRWWNGLTADQRQVIQKAVGDTEQMNIQAVKDEYSNDVAAVQKAGDTLTAIEGSTRDAWIKADAPLKDVYLSMAGSEGKMFLQDIANAANNGN